MEKLIDALDKEWKRIVMPFNYNNEDYYIQELIIPTCKAFNEKITKEKNINKSNFFEASQEIVTIINELTQEEINSLKNDEAIVIQNAFTNANMCIKTYMDCIRKRIMDMLANRPVKHKIEDMSKEELIAYIKENML